MVHTENYPTACSYLQYVSPAPNYVPGIEKPSSLQTTLASRTSQPVWQTVDQTLCKQTSTRPSKTVRPSARRISPSGQPAVLLDILGWIKGTTFHQEHSYIPSWHLTPASWAWVQRFSPLELAEQSLSLTSLPVHCTPSSHTVPEPWPKLAPLKASAPTH